MFEKLRPTGKEVKKLKCRHKAKALLMRTGGASDDVRVGATTVHVLE